MFPDISRATLFAGVLLAITNDLPKEGPKPCNVIIFVLNQMVLSDTSATICALAIN